MTPATPMLATLTEAAPVEELPLAPVVVAAADVGLADEALFNVRHLLLKNLRLHTLEWWRWW